MTLFARPSESSLWYGWPMSGRLSSGTGGTGSSGSACNRSSWLPEADTDAESDARRFLRGLNSFDMRRRCDDDASLRPSSEFWRLLRRSVAPSPALDMVSSLLLAIDTVDDAAPLESARGVASVFSASRGAMGEPMLLRRSCCAAMVVGVVGVGVGGAVVAVVVVVVIVGVWEFARDGGSRAGRCSDSRRFLWAAALGLHHRLSRRCRGAGRVEAAVFPVGRLAGVGDEDLLRRSRLWRRAPHYWATGYAQTSLGGGDHIGGMAGRGCGGCGGGGGSGGGGGGGEMEGRVAEACVCVYIIWRS